MNCNNNNLGLNANSCNDGLRHIEQIALNKAGIDCLGGRVCRAEADIKDRYTKAELDRMLARKMDRCGNDRTNCNGKPNICDYYTKEELDQILAEIACKCDTYSKEELDELLDKIACTCDCYSKTEVDELLSNKANIGPPTNYEINGIVSDDHTGYGYYTKDQNNLVTLQAIIFNQDNRSNHLVTLPQGFRPKDRPVYLIVAALNDAEYLGPAFITINTYGAVYVYSTPENTNNVGLFTSFYSQ